MTQSVFAKLNCAALNPFSGLKSATCQVHNQKNSPLCASEQWAILICGAHLYLQTVSSKLRALLYQEHTSNILKLTNMKCFAYPQHKFIHRTKIVFKTRARAPRSVSTDLKSGFELQGFFLHLFNMRQSPTRPRKWQQKNLLVSPLKILFVI